MIERSIGGRCTWGVGWADAEAAAGAGVGCGGAVTAGDAVDGDGRLAWTDGCVLATLVLVVPA